ncbi:hypothetical protein ACT4_019_00980 [Acinetobacter sp. NBRC 100985]|nr:hypothetical protein ACT4_019_00980 [Acinetobacter sp. NBRC 100985]
MQYYSIELGVIDISFKITSLELLIIFQQYMNFIGYTHFVITVSLSCALSLARFYVKYKYLMFKSKYI